MIFGGFVDDGRIAVHPSDTPPTLIAWQAQVQTSKRRVPAQDFFRVEEGTATILDPDEILTEIHLAPPAGKSAFGKFPRRKAIDVPLVNCAALVAVSEEVVTAARICLKAVHVAPYRVEWAEQVLVGPPLDEAQAEAAVSKARPRKRNGYMVKIARELVKRTILDCR